MKVLHRSCDQLGVCQALDLDLCPDCDSFECEVNVPTSKPTPMRAVKKVPCSTYQFAPGVIEGPKKPVVYMDKDGPWRPLSLVESVKLLALLLTLSVLAGYLVERFA